MQCPPAQEPKRASEDIWCIAGTVLCVCMWMPEINFGVISGKQHTLFLWDRLYIPWWLLANLKVIDLPQPSKCWCYGSSHHADSHFLLRQDLLLGGRACWLASGLASGIHLTVSTYPGLGYRHAEKALCSLNHIPRPLASLCTCVVSLSPPTSKATENI